MDVQQIVTTAPGRGMFYAPRQSPPSARPTAHTRLSPSLFATTIGADVLAANVKAHTAVMVQRLGTILAGDDDARTFGAYCTAVRVLLKGSAEAHGMTAPDGRPLRSLRDYVRAYFDVPLTDDFKAPGSVGKRIINTINHYSNTYGGADPRRTAARATRAPIDALRAYIGRMFPKLASLDEAHRIVVDVTTRYEALARATAAAARSPASPSVRTAA